MFEQAVTWLLFFSLFYLLITTVILIRNRAELTALRPKGSTASQNRKISVCIPARNEENNIGQLLDSLIKQTHSNFDIHLLDDQSTDNTYQIADEYREQYPEKVNLHSGKPKPDGWLGKPWACNQLGNLCDGELIVFLDADTLLGPAALEQISNSFDYDSTDMITVWPRQILGTFWEKSVIPLIYYALVTLLPAIYVYRKPRWMPAFAHSRFRHIFAAACGQCIAFRKDVYNEIGGHSSVKSEIVEDVELAKRIKRDGFTMRMYHGVGTVNCRMYRSEAEMFEGLRKNFLQGFKNSLPLFTLSALIHLIVFILPFITLVAALFYFNTIILYLSIASVGLILLHRLVLSGWFRWDPIYAFTHPIGVIWFQKLGLVKIVDYLFGRKSEWKGRKV
ncbi:MAG: glycosyltransferase [Balneolaceae bacterium]|nr:glycosyltransferase [Balneolaceae bacterium]